MNKYIWLYQITSMPRTMFFLYICQNTILKSNEIQLYTGALRILLASEYSNTYSSNAILKCQPFLFWSPSHIHTPQDTDGSVISIAIPLMPQCTYLAPCLGATVKTLKQNASMDSNLICNLFCRISCQLLSLSSLRSGWNSLHST